ncbi:MAG: hypothetical protein SPK16_06910 [Corynebacterium sp.]|nr:hypothetical protein [Corynebacterium sp.]
MLGVSAGPVVANAQIPAGLDPAQVQQMLPSQIEVAAGESTSVDVGVPVNVGYASGGWNVSASGTVVTVTAPDQPGATASVPVSAAGYSAVVNLVAVGDGAGTAGVADTAPNGTADGDAAQGDAANEGANGGAAEGAAPSGPVNHPERELAAPVEMGEAVRLDFEGTITDNVITVKVPFSQARELMQYMGTDREGATLRYVDVNGQIIEGVTRDVDIASRTLTLTYPEGETPDNPFIMEVVRDDARTEFLAVITSTNAPLEAATVADSPYAQFGGTGTGAEAPVEQSTTDTWRQAGPMVLGGLGVILLLGAVAALATRRRRNHNGVTYESTR